MTEERGRVVNARNLEDGGIPAASAKQNPNINETCTGYKQHLLIYGASNSVQGWRISRIH